jgi:hypothetical protein
LRTAKRVLSSEKYAPLSVLLSAVAQTHKNPVHDISKVCEDRVGAERWNRSGQVKVDGHQVRRRLGVVMDGRVYCEN